MDIETRKHGEQTVIGLVLSTCAVIGFFFVLAGIVLYRAMAS